jgi:hypothetical protein
MPAFNSETWWRFCDGLASNIVVQYSVGPITAREYIGRLDNRGASHDPDISKQQLELFSYSLKDMKVSIFPDQHNHQI